ncbi:MAG: hypothetical protein ACFB21_04565 [Opitutales bacterium]
MKPPVTLEIPRCGLRGVARLMPLERDFQSELLPVGAVLDS